MAKKYYKFELNVTILSILSIVILIGLIMLDGLLMGDRVISFDDNTFIILILAYFAYVAIHEIFHGIGFSLFVKDKKNVKYGAALEKGVFYAMCQERISKKGIIVSLLFPIIFLTLIPYPIAIICNWPLLEILALCNLAAAVGDLALLGLVVKLPKNIQYIDYDNVIGAYFVSEDDLSKYKALCCKFKECGEDSDDLINKNIKFITVSKASWIYMVIIVLLCLILAII